MSDIVQHLRTLQSRLEKSVEYSIHLQKAIEYHCRGEVVPDRIAERCRYHAEMLNKRKEQINATIRSSGSNT